MRQAQLKHGRITQADYEREWDEAQAAINKHRERLNDKTEVDQLLAALTDLGSTIRMMTPLKRKTNLARLFDIIEVDDDGRICAVVPQLWTLDAFQAIIASTTPKMGRVGLKHNSGVIPQEDYSLITMLAAGLAPMAG